MPENLLLIIIASDEFRDIHLKDKKDEHTPLISSTLIALEEPMEGLENPWKDELQKLVIDEIRKFNKSATVRVAGHIGPCFDGRKLETPTRVENVMHDRRLPDKEAMLKESLDADLDIQVWGFHHDERSGIWRALVNAGQVARYDVTDEEKRVIEARLIKAFEDAQAAASAAEESDRKRTQCEHLAVIAHDILRQFSPLRIKLDSAADREAAAVESGNLEYSERSRLKAETLREEVRKLLPEKLTRARAVLDEAVGITPKVKNNDWWKMASQKMASPPSVKREEFCKWVDELSDILNHLVRAFDA
jgi:hypothetical protein